MTSGFGLVLTIAGVEIQVRSRISMLDRYDSPYAPFLSAVPSGRGAISSVDVSVLSTLCPPNDSPLLFESGGAWNMQPEPGGYRLNFHRQGSGDYHTVALANGDTTEVKVYVDQDEPARESSDPRHTSPVCYPLDQLLLIHHLAGRGGVVVHGGAVVVQGRALAYLGASGAGKSTLSRLFVEAGMGDDLLSDDRVILRVGSAGQSACEVWGTPWPGDAGIAANAHAPLAALLFLVQSTENRLEPLSPAAGMKRLVRVASCPWYDAERLPGALDTCARVVEHHPCYALHFRPDERAVSLLTGASWA